MDNDRDPENCYFVMGLHLQVAIIIGSSKLEQKYLHFLIGELCDNKRRRIF